MACDPATRRERIVPSFRCTPWQSMSITKHETCFGGLIFNSPTARWPTDDNCSTVVVQARIWVERECRRSKRGSGVERLGVNKRNGKKRRQKTSACEKENEAR
eukprot:4278771-Pleurochrysis_carterae.AAC.1